MQKKWISPVIVLFILQFLFLPAIPVHAGLPGWAKAVVNQPIPEYDDLKVDYVILYNEAAYLINKDETFELTHRLAVKIISKDGLSNAIQVIFFNEGEKIAGLKGFHQTKAGKVIEFNNKELIETTVIKDAFHADEKQLVMGFKDVNPGDIIILEYVRTFTPYIFTLQHQFQNSTMPVLTAKFSVSLPKNWQYNAFIPVKPELVKKQTIGTVVEWSCTNLALIEEEELLPPHHLICPGILLQILTDKPNPKAPSNWDQFGLWFSNLWKDKTACDTAIAHKVGELTDSLITIQEKIEAITEFVQKNIHYLQIYVKEGRFMPPYARETFRNCYGDCKAKTSLTIAMLKGIQVTAFPVLVMTKNEDQVYPDWVGSQFNHVIAAIKIEGEFNNPSDAIINAPTNSKLLLFDPTDTETPIGEIPWIIQGTKGLILEPEKCYFVDLPQYSGDKITQLNRISGSLSGTGTLEASYQQDEYLHKASESRYYWSSAESQKHKELLTSYLSQQLTNPAVIFYQITHASPKPAHIAVNFSVPGFAKQYQNLLAFKPNVLSKSDRQKFASQTRQVPLYFAAPYHNIDSITIVLPATYEVDELPPATKLEIPGMSFAMNCTVSNDTLHYFRQAIRTVTFLHESEFPKVKEYLEKRYLADNQQVVLKVNPEKDQKIKDILTKLRQQPNNPQVMVETADLYFNCRLYPEAIKYYQDALNYSAQNPGRLYFYIGTSYYHLRNFKEGIEMAKKADALGYPQAKKLIDLMDRLGIVY